MKKINCVELKNNFSSYLDSVVAKNKKISVKTENVVISKMEITTQHGAIQGKTAFGKDYFKELLERVFESC